MPSVVAFGPDGAILVGQSAANKRTARQKAALDNALTAGNEGDGDEDAGVRSSSGAAIKATDVQENSNDEWAVFSSIKRVIGRSAAAAREAGEDLALLGAAPENMRLRHLLQTARLQELKATAAEATRAKAGGDGASSSSSSSSSNSPTAAATAAAAAAVAVQGKGAEPVVLACPPRRLKTAASASAAAEGTATVGSDNEIVNTEGCLLPEEVSAEVVRSLLATAKAALEGMNLPPSGGAAPANTGGNAGATGADATTMSVNIPRAVITVPAYFTPAQCAATEQAGLAAGLQRVRLLKEPEAAALAYGLGTQGQAGKENELVLVFDLGGGTLDVSVLEVLGRNLLLFCSLSFFFSLFFPIGFRSFFIHNFTCAFQRLRRATLLSFHFFLNNLQVGGGVIEVIATSGDGHLGGDDFDDAIAELWAQQLMAAQKAATAGGSGSNSIAQQQSKSRSASSSSIDAKLKMSSSARLALRRLAERAKCALSRSALVQVALHPADFGLGGRETTSAAVTEGSGNSGGGGNALEERERSRVLESNENADAAARDG